MVKPTATPSVRMKRGGGKRRVTELKEVSVFDEYRHAYGVYNLMKCMSVKPRDGHAYHIITGGHVDLLAHLGWLMVHWPRIESLMMSCWQNSVLRCSTSIRSRASGTPGSCNSSAKCVGASSGWST